MRLIVLSFDAVWREDFAFLCRQPNFGRLVAAGGCCDSVETVYPSLTYPAHVTMVTGCQPGAHGVYHNQPFTPQAAEDRRPWYWDSRVIRVPTLYQACAAKGLDCASVLWPVTGKSPFIRRNFPEVVALPGENQVWKMLRYGSPLWILAMEARYGKRRPSTQEPHLSDYAALLAERLLSGRRPPDLLTVHFTDCDETRHRFGARSPQAEEALVRLDQRLGRVLKAAPGDAVTAVVSDHGQQDIRQVLCLSDKLREKGFAQAADRVQSCGMGAYIWLEDISLLPRLRQCLEAEKAFFGIQRVYGGEALSAMGAPAELPLAVEAAPYVVFQDQLEPEKREKATHGFGPGREEDLCLLAMAGPGVRPGSRVEKARLADLAPTFAALLGVELPQAQGRPLAELLTKSGD